MLKNMFPTVSIPSFPYFCNMVVFPAAGGQEESSFWILKKTSALSKDSGRKLLLEYLPGYIYCLLPSSQEHQGTVSMNTSRPNFLKDYTFCFPSKHSQVDLLPALVDDEDQEIDIPKGCSSCF